MKLQSLVLSVVALGLVNCTRPHGNHSNSTNPDAVTYDVPLKILDVSSLDSAQKSVAAKIEAHQPVSFNEISQMMVDRHVKGAKAGFPDVTSPMMQKFLGGIAPAKPMTPAKTKIYYEQQIKTLLGVDLKYNIDATSVVNIYKEERMQCYSGTYLYELIRRRVGAKAFHAGNEVVIFQAGHVLPGYMVKDGKGFHLIGIETTESGGARQDFGMAADLNGMSVVDAELFAISEVFADQISNAGEFTAAALKTTAKKYGIPLTAAPTSGTGASADPETKRQLNQSLFAFGQPADDTPGDRVRGDSGDDGTAPDVQATKTVASSMLRPEAFDRLEATGCAELAGIYKSDKGAMISVEVPNGCGKIMLQKFDENATPMQFQVWGPGQENTVILSAGKTLAHFSLSQRVLQFGGDWTGDRFYTWAGIRTNVF